MPKEQQKQGPSRQRPVSCHFCRKRKLRCSRTVPCFNCASRGITCDLEHPVAQPSSTPSTSENSEILERLHRLESLLAAQQKGEEQEQNGQPSDVAESRPQLVHPSASPPQIQNIEVDGDVASLESVYIDQIPSTKIPRTRVVFRTCPVARVTKAQSYIYPSEFHSITNSEPPRCIWLPSRAEARILLEKFIRVAHHLPYVTHVPSLPSVLEQAYADLNQQRQIQSGQVILLLSIFAAATHAWVQSDCAYGLFPTSAEANDQASLWIKAAEDVLDIACRSPKVSMEGVQGAVLVGFVASHLDGLHRCRVLFAMGIVLARDLGLHRIDHPSNAGMANTARAEIGRRIWWYLISLAEISRSIVDRSPLVMAHSGGLSHDAVMDIDTELQTLINDVPAFYSMSESALMETYGLTQTEAENIIFQGKTTYFLLYSQRCKIHLPYFARGVEDPAYYSSREICIKHARLIIQSELWQENSDIDTATRFKFTGLLIGVFLACIVLLMDLCVNPLSPQYEKQREEVYKAFKIIEEAKKKSETTAKFVDSLVHILRKYNVPPLKSVPKQQLQSTAYRGSGGGSEQQSQAIPCKEMVLDISETPGYNECGERAFPRASHGQCGVSDGLGHFMAADGPPNESGDDLSSFWNDFTQNFEQGIDVNSFDWDNIFLSLDSSFF
ncbi:hypothetical protein NA57DRAFT_69468 [Rhizodiscina lignyota]|uniref:Zn(2)-C6 fungal-type domain-containing protein n=1 Tax=Rhizodiscina lignyota TaxID=1504668 RepID=A0A9P4I6V1_9PEZI|nr:hypothetical protein NA57DRAFT_69468 [Rhizodiscina lignyota]